MDSAGFLLLLLGWSSQSSWRWFTGAVTLIVSKLRTIQLKSGNCWNIGIDRDEDSELID